MADRLILTDEEKEMLEGRQGPGVRKAMEMVLSLGARAQPFLKEMYARDRAVSEGR